MRVIKSLFLGMALIMAAGSVMAQGVHMTTNSTTGEVHLHDGAGSDRLVVLTGASAAIPVSTNAAASANSTFTTPPAVLKPGATLNSATHDNFTVNSAWIAAVVPLLLAFLKTMAPQMPKKYIPLVAPILGAALDAIASWMTGNTINPQLGAAVGIMGVGIREILDQWHNPAPSVEPDPTATPTTLAPKTPPTP